MYEENLFDHRTAVPEQYIYVSANPGYSHIMYCLPRESIAIPSPFNASALRSHVVVVKVRRRPKIFNEHSALLSIRDATGSVADVAKKHFLDFLDVSDFTSGSELSLASITLPAILPSITLADWSKAAAETENPVPFVYHVFLSLGTALRFLHKTCALEHGDVHDGNVLLRLNNDSPFGLPELLLIDFESQKRVDGESRDYFDAMTIVHLLAQEAETSADRTWAGFKQALSVLVMDRKAQAERKLGVNRFEDVWEECKDIAEDGRNRVSKEAVAVTRDIFEKAVEQNGDVVTDDELRMAVESVSSP